MSLLISEMYSISVAAYEVLARDPYPEEAHKIDYKTCWGMKREKKCYVINRGAYFVLISHREYLGGDSFLKIANQM